MAEQSNLASQSTSAPRAGRSIAQELRRLILLSALPFVALIGLLGYFGYRNAHNNAEESVRHLASRVSGDVTKFIGETERGLRLAAARPDVQRMDPAHCDPGLGDLIAIQPRYINVNMTDREGWVICGAVAPRGGPRSENRSNREWFQAVKAGAPFAIGAPRKGSIVGRWIVTTGIPVRGADGQFNGAISVSFDLAKWELPGLEGVLPNEAVVGVLDKAGTIVMRYPESDKWVGRNSRDTEIVARMLGVQHGVFVARGILGFDRVWAVTPIQGTDWFAFAGIRASTVLGPPLRETAFAVALAAAALMLAVWFALMASRQLTRPIAGIARAARARASGRNELVPVAGPGEIQEVAHELNRMILARQEAIETVEKSERRFHRTLDELTEGCMFIGFDWTYLYVNKAAARHGRREVTNLIGRTMLDAYPGIETTEIFARYRRAMEDRVPQKFEGAYSFPEGPAGWFEFTVEPSSEGIFVLSMDISERKRAETLLRTRVRLTELAQTGTLDDLLQHALDAAEEITGSQIGFFHFVDPDQEHLTLQAWSTNTLKNMCTAEGKGQHYAISEAGVWVDCFHTRLPVIHNDYASLAHRKGMPEGHARVTRELVVPIIRAGKVTEIMGVGNKATDYVERDVEAVEMIASLVQDFVDRLRFERAMQESDTRFRALVEQGGDGFELIDEQGRILDVNQASCEQLGYSREELVQLTVFDIVPSTNREKYQYSFKSLVNQRPVTFESVHRRKDGTTFPVEVTRSVIPVDGRWQSLTLVRDITERKQLEQARLNSQKLESLGTLSGGIAHDFNNILAAIMGNADLAAKDVGPDHAAAESLEEISKASARASELVRRIMAFSRPKEARQEIVDLSTVVGEVLKLLRSTLPAGISLQQNFAPDTPAVLADAGQIHEVIVNLTTNAAYAIGPRAGSIEYRLDPVQVGEKLAQGIPGLKPGRYARLTVSDNGCGMDAATQSRIFDAFYTTKPVGEGTGLGLSMVHGIMRSHRGAVTVESIPGTGSTFALYFPAAVEQIQKQEPTAPVQSLLSAGQRVLYVDDEEALVFLASRVLSRLGHSISGFTNPKEALEAFRAHPQDFDVLVTDLSMPHMSGFDLARAVLNLRPEIPVLMTTGYLRTEDENLARAAGIRELILKPVTVDELGRVLDRLFRDTRAENRTV